MPDDNDTTKEADDDESTAAMIDEWRCMAALDALLARGNRPPAAAECRALLPGDVL